MKLSAYMQKHGLSLDDVARLVGDVSASGVLKWSRGERVPRPDQQRRIHEITKGEVEPNDFILPAAEPERAAS